jgi:predicted metal-binding membrane protein
MAAGTAPSQVTRLFRGLGEWAAWHPEWWVLAISAGAWLIMALSATGSFVPRICYSPSFGPIESSFVRLRVWPLSSQLAPEYVGWLLMTIAMMLPLTVFPVRHVAFRSFSWRRNRAVASFLIGYLLVWALVGAALVPVLIAARALEGSGGRFALTVGLMLAAVWQLTPSQLRASRRCHRTIALSAAGWRADADCVRFGVGTGGNCAFSCWALMLTPALASHSLLAMTCVQAVALHERYELRPRSRVVIPILLTGAAMIYSFALAIA